MKDDADIKREIQNMYSRTNMLLCRFDKCSLPVKLCLFRSYCLCLYGTALWSKYNATTLLQLKYCYHKCIKMFFGYAKCHSITDMLLNLRLPSFNTVMHNFRYVLTFSGIRVLMTWLCTIESCIWIFLHSSDCVSVCLVCIFCHLPVPCPLFTMDPCGLK